MPTEQPRGYEYKHVEVPQNQALVDLVTNTYAMFYWEVMATQTVVAKEAHLESGEFNPDNLYSVITTERFVAIDFRRATDTANLQKIKQIEQDYFVISASLANLGCSPLDRYSSAPPKQLNWLVLGLGFLFYIVPGILYLMIKNKKHKGAVERWKELKPSLDRLIDGNRSVLNMPS